jgi:hypothetical protein
MTKMNKKCTPSLLFSLSEIGQHLSLLTYR